MIANFPPARMNLRDCFLAMANYMRAHAAAYHILHELQPSAQVGMAYSHRPFRPSRWWHPLDWVIYRFADRHFNEIFMDPVRHGTLNFLFQKAVIREALGTQDFIGLNYYSVDDMFFAFKPKQLFIDRRFPKGSELSETGFIASLPKGLLRSMQWAGQFKLPIYITENGVEGSRDTLRPKYIIDHLYQTWRGIQLKLPILGYYYWSIVDNFEWERGWTQRFGLYALDIATQERTARPSVEVFARICRENGLPFDLVEKFSPGLLNELKHL
jgi:beta-glucosidase